MRVCAGALFSFNLALNDLDEYEGGGTYFRSLEGSGDAAALRSPKVAYPSPSRNPSPSPSTSPSPSPNANANPSPNANPNPNPNPNPIPIPTPHQDGSAFQTTALHWAAQGGHVAAVEREVSDDTEGPPA